MRLNVYLARCGVASRRGADEVIARGRVTVNGRTAAAGEVVDPRSDEVAVDGRRLALSEAHTTILLYKPAGYLVSRRDPHHTRTIYDVLPPHLHRLVPVGRLDLDTEGVLLLSDDGALVERLTHPRYQVAKVYHAVVAGRPDDEAVNRLRRGVEIEGRMTSPAKVRVVNYESDRTALELTLREGRKRQVRLMCREVGHPVTALRRISFAGIRLKDMKKGQWRPLTDEELTSLRRQTEPADGSGH